MKTYNVGEIVLTDLANQEHTLMIGSVVAENEEELKRSLINSFKVFINAIDLNGADLEVNDE